MSTRPNCQKPDACAAKGAGHCRSCHFSSVAKALNQDPEFAAKRDERIKALNQDPEFAAKRDERIKALNQDPEFAAKRDERSRNVMKALHQDPEFAAKRDERIKALNQDPEFAAKRDERIKARRAEKIKALGLRDQEEREWRAIKAKGFSADEAARIIIKSRKDSAA